MSDRALDFAKFIAEESDHLHGDALERATVERFADLTREQYERGLAIGEEMLAMKAAEYRAEAAALRAVVAERQERRDDDLATTG